MEKTGGIQNIMHYSMPVHENGSVLKCEHCINFEVLDNDTVCLCCSFFVMHTEKDNLACDYFYYKEKE